jgi:hypothetical protein
MSTFRYFDFLFHLHIDLILFIRFTLYSIVNLFNWRCKFDGNLAFLFSISTCYVVLLCTWTRVGTFDLCFWCFVLNILCKCGEIKLLECSKLYWLENLCFGLLVEVTWNLGSRLTSNQVIKYSMHTRKKVLKYVDNIELHGIEKIVSFRVHFSTVMQVIQKTLTQKISS